jgi:hypothetical protein
MRFLRGPRATKFRGPILGPYVGPCQEKR